MLSNLKYKIPERISGFCLVVQNIFEPEILLTKSKMLLTKPEQITQKMRNNS